MSSAKRFTTSGSAAKAWMLGSQGSFATASASALSFNPGFLASHCWSWISSRGYVDAARVWATNWSGGILAAWSCAKDAGVQGVGGRYANALPGTITNEQTITSTSRKAALKNFGSGF